jgi:anti-sigma regulatory factor (Ser/Thr protein kinase)
MHRVIAVTEQSNVGQVRRAITEIAKRGGASEEVTARAALVATELCTNLVKHSTQGGELLFRQLHANGNEVGAIEMVAIDKGRGIANISRAFNDGFSTAGSPGTGLGAIQRMSDAMEIFSVQSGGTVISALVRERNNGDEKTEPLQIRSICVPLEGYDVSGDQHCMVARGSTISVILADGLGHGEEAAEASYLATLVFQKHINCDLKTIMGIIHNELVSTRGAAVAMARIDMKLRTLQYVAVGNIDSRICSEKESHGCATLNGTAGLRLPQLQQFEYKLPAGAILIMHTDGISGRWNLRDFPGLSLQTPGAVAAVLYRDFARKRDDATILVLTT